MKTVHFMFDVGERVETCFDDIGIITMCGYDDAGIKYYVQRDQNSDWFKEKDLAKVMVEDNK